MLATDYQAEPEALATAMAGGALFGAAGLTLAAPLTAAATSTRQIRLRKGTAAQRDPGATAVT